VPASGKSTYCEWLAGRGWAFIDHDRVTGRTDDQRWWGLVTTSSPSLALRAKRCSSCRLAGCPLRDTPATRVRPSAVGWVRTPHDDQSLTKPATHAAAAVAPLPGVVICQVTMRSTSRGFWPRFGQAVRLPPTSFNDSDGVRSRLSRITCFLSEAYWSRRSEASSWPNCVDAPIP
jgi:hypothetical protein